MGFVGWREEIGENIRGEQVGSWGGNGDMEEAKKKKKRKRVKSQAHPPRVGISALFRECTSGLGSISPAFGAWTISRGIADDVQ